jgi:hypothetical protein
MTTDRHGTSAPPGGMPSALSRLVAAVGEAAKPRPVERWNPDWCGEIDMRIAADGTWFYRGSAIGREALVRLFASILRREPDGRHVLVTPVEKVGIEVEDAPFLAVDMVAEGEGANRVLTFRTNMGDIVAAGPERPLRFETDAANEGLKPYLTVRGRLEALVTRSLTQDLVALADERDGKLGLSSGGAFFVLPSAADG